MMVEAKTFKNYLGFEIVIGNTKIRLLRASQKGAFSEHTRLDYGKRILDIKIFVAYSAGLDLYNQDV